MCIFATCAPSWTILAPQLIHTVRAWAIPCRTKIGYEPALDPFRLVVWYAGLLTTVIVLLGHSLRPTPGLPGDNIVEASRAGATNRRDPARQRETDRRALVVREVQAVYAPELSGRFIRITRADGSVLYRSGPPNDQNFDPRSAMADVSTRREFNWKQVLPTDMPCSLRRFVPPPTGARRTCGGRRSDRTGGDGAEPPAALAWDWPALGRAGGNAAAIS